MDFPVWLTDRSVSKARQDGKDILEEEVSKYQDMSRREALQYKPNESQFRVISTTGKQRDRGIGPPEQGNRIIKHALDWVACIYFSSVDVGSVHLWRGGGGRNRGCRERRYQGNKIK